MMKRYRETFSGIVRWVVDFWWRVRGGVQWGISLLGIASVLWLIFRSGARPTRIVYPCQRVAVANVQAWVGLSLIGLVSRFRSRVRHFVISSRVVPVALAAAGFAVLGLAVGKSFNWASAARSRALRKAADKVSAALSASSSVFVVEKGGGPDGLRHLSLDRLINLLGVHGVRFYRTEKQGIACSPTGLIGPDDVVLIKVNCQWPERGGTNTDLLKGLIYRITQHPDGFTGEIVVADCGQGRGSLNHVNSNAEDHGQSAQDVVNLFSGSYKVSTYLWDNIREQLVSEFDQNDTRDGFVREATPDPQSNFRVSYAKFTTPYGTQISVKRGIYKPGKPTGAYDKDKFKIINFPVLKSHSGFAVTACVKHYMGVQSQPLSDGHNRLSSGSMGSLFVGLGLPVLNILDAIWVNANPIGQPGNGPPTTYGDASRLDTLMASLDPFALDYWASKNVLTPAALARGYTNVDSMNPDKPGVFRTYLESAKNIVLLAGHPVTTDPEKITVFKAADERPFFMDVTIDQSGDIALKWLEIAPGSYQYTVEQTADLQGPWQPVPGHTWPILTTEWTGTGADSDGVCFYRVKRERGPK